MRGFSRKSEERRRLLAFCATMSSLELGLALADMVVDVEVVGGEGR